MLNHIATDNLLLTMYPDSLPYEMREVDEIIPQESTERIRRKKSTRIRRNVHGEEDDEKNLLKVKEDR